MKEYHKLTWRIAPIENMADLQKRVVELGFLPMFRSTIKGFSVYESTDNFWPDSDDGPWEWKGPIIREGECVYGKFFNRKAGWISREWFADFINYRRTKHLAPNEDTAAIEDIVLQVIESEGYITSKMMARTLGLSGWKKKRKADDLVDHTGMTEKISLDSILSRLMMEGRVVIADFVYNIDKRGNPYGWGIAKYSTPENLYGDLSVERSAKESYERMFSHLRKVLPSASDTRIRKLLG